MKKLDKRNEMNRLLEFGTVRVIVNPMQSGCTLPPHLYKKEQCAFDIGHDCAVPIPDLDVTDWGWSGTLAFSGKQFWCSVPWSAVELFGLTDDDDIKAAQKAQMSRLLPQPTPTERSSAERLATVTHIDDWKRLKGLR